MPVGKPLFSPDFRFYWAACLFNHNMAVEDELKHRAEMAENVEKGEARQHQDVRSMCRVRLTIVVIV